MPKKKTVQGLAALLNQDSSSADMPKMSKMSSPPKPPAPSMENEGSENEFLTKLRDDLRAKADSIDDYLNNGSSEENTDNSSMMM